MVVTNHLASVDARTSLLGKPGGQWIRSAPEKIDSVWGLGDQVAWAKGETFMVAGSDGTGKTVLAHNLILRMIGIIEEPLLGLPVARSERVLYLAQDRPIQAKRGLKRMVGDMDEDDLDERLVVFDSPLNETVEQDQDLLVRIAEQNSCDSLIVDSLKDITRQLSDEETGQALKRAYQRAQAAGVDVALLHHNRKSSQGANKRELLRLADVYGSRLITAGCGSVIGLNGASGDPIVELRHLKQVAEEVGPIQVHFDFTTGGLSIFRGSDIVSLIAKSPDGMTAKDAASELYSSTDRASIERARRKLDSEVASGRLHKKQDGPSVKAPVRYYPIAKVEEPA